jgi:hypothetical protein
MAREYHVWQDVRMSCMAAATKSCSHRFMHGTTSASFSPFSVPSAAKLPEDEPCSDAARRAGRQQGTIHAAWWV